MGILWRDLWVRLKLRPTPADLVHVISGWVDGTWENPNALQMSEVLDRYYPRAEWTADLKRQMEKVARKIGEGASRGEQARLCRRQLLNQIEACATHKVVLALDENLRDHWLAVEYADIPYSADQRTNAFLVRWAFDPMVLTAIHGLYVSQYNSTLNELEFSTPYQTVCEGYCEVLAKTLCVRSGDASFIYPAATAYDDLVASPIEPRLRQVKERLATAVEMNDMPAIRAATSDGAAAFEEYQVALDRFKAALSQ